jgi:hypothetical protein
LILFLIHYGEIRGDVLGKLSRNAQPTSKPRSATMSQPPMLLK